MGWRGSVFRRRVFETERSICSQTGAAIEALSEPRSFAFSAFLACARTRGHTSRAARINSLSVGDGFLLSPSLAGNRTQSPYGSGLLIGLGYLGRHARLGNSSVPLCCDPRQ